MLAQRTGANGAIDGADQIPDHDLLGRLRQGVPAHVSAAAFHEAGLARPTRIASRNFSGTLARAAIACACSQRPWLPCRAHIARSPYLALFVNIPI